MVSMLRPTPREHAEFGDNRCMTTSPQSPTNDELPDDVLKFAERIFDGARTGKTEFVTSAIDQGLSVNLADASGNTLLMLAAYHGHSELVAQLLERGADANRVNDRGQTPVAGAVFKRYDAIISLLVGHGADLDAGVPSARATAQMFGVDLGASGG